MQVARVEVTRISQLASSTTSDSRKRAMLSTYDLEKLRNVGDGAYRQMASYARSVVRHFVQDPNSSWLRRMLRKP